MSDEESEPTSSSGDQPDPATPHVSERCRRNQHEMCRGRVYVFPPVNGRTVVPCGCTVCNHPTRWRGRPARQRPTP